MIEIHLLEQLDAFAKYGTLSAAAEYLHTSQPALTRSMKKLEEELEVSLFMRKKNYIELNETGLLAAEYAKRVLDADHDFVNKVRAFNRSLYTISIGYCAPVPQAVLTPIINNLFDGMTISADISDDTQFVERLKNHEYHLTVLHEKPEDEMLYAKKIGHEDLYISLTPGDPLTFHPEIRLSDLDGKSILLLSRLGFWSNTHMDKTPNAHYLLQIDKSSYYELSLNSSYPAFSSSYYIKRGELIPGRINVPIVDPECHADYYLVCLNSEKEKYRQLFDLVNENTI